MCNTMDCLFVWVYGGWVYVYWVLYVAMIYVSVSMLVLCAYVFVLDKCPMCACVHIW